MDVIQCQSVVVLYQISVKKANYNVGTLNRWFLFGRSKYFSQLLFNEAGEFFFLLGETSLLQLLINCRYSFNMQVLCYGSTNGYHQQGQKQSLERRENFYIPFIKARHQLYFGTSEHKTLGINYSDLISSSSITSSFIWKNPSQLWTVIQGSNQRILN